MPYPPSHSWDIQDDIEELAEATERASLAVRPEKRKLILRLRAEAAPEDVEKVKKLLKRYGFE